MFAPIQKLLNVPSVQAVLGNPVRAYAFGEAPKKPVYPYLVYQTITGQPENYLGDRPDVDSETLQLDVWDSSNNSKRALQVAKLVRDAVEEDAYVSGWRGDSRDPETDDVLVSFEVDFITNRN